MAFFPLALAQAAALDCVSSIEERLIGRTAVYLPGQSLRDDDAEDRKWTDIEVFIREEHPLDSAPGPALLFERVEDERDGKKNDEAKAVKQSVRLDLAVDVMCWWWPEKQQLSSKSSKKTTSKGDGVDDEAACRVSEDLLADRCRLAVKGVLSAIRSAIVSLINCELNQL